MHNKLLSFTKFEFLKLILKDKVLTAAETIWSFW